MRKPLAKTLSVIMLFLIVLINFNLTTVTNEFLLRVLTTNVEHWKLTFAYIFSLLSILLLLGVFEVFNSKVRETYFFWTSLMLIIIYFSSVSAFASGTSQRVAFIVLSYLFPVLALYIDLILKEKKMRCIVRDSHNIQ